MNQNHVIVGLTGALGVGGLMAFSIVAGIIAGAVLGLGAVSWAGWLVHQRIHDDMIRMEHDRIGVQKARAEIKAAYRQAEVVAITGTNGSLAVSDTSGADWQTIQPVLRAPVMHPGMIPPPDKPKEIPVPKLLPAIEPLDRIAIFGGMGCGKSELLKHLASSRSTRADVIIIDSHAAPNTWPVGRVVGMGRDYSEIEAFLNAIMQELNNRYTQLSQGFTGFSPICIIIDEMTVLNQFVDASEIFKSLLCECRKVAIQMIVAGQSDRVRSLGIQGNGDLKQAFEAVVYLEKNGDYYGNVYQGYSREPVKMSHPGVYQGAVKRSNQGDNFRRPDAWTEPRYPEDEPVREGYPTNQAIDYRQEPDFDSEARTAIYNALYHRGALSPKEVAQITGLKGGYIRKTLKEMVQAGYIRIHSRGVYGL